jgi:acetyl esterase/lipase
MLMRAEAKPALDPDVRRLLRMLSLGGVSDPSTLTPRQMRQRFAAWAQTVDVRNAPIGRIENFVTPGPAGPVPVRLYAPEGATGPLPGFVYIHGGGCIFGDLETHDGLCRVLSHESGAIVLAIDYRCAPEHPYPAALEDCTAVVDWFAQHANELGIAPDALGIAGDSAGAGLAVTICRMAREGGPRLSLQLLFSPVLDLRADTPSRREFAVGYFLTQATIDWMLQHICATGIMPDDARLSPLRAGDFSGLPPAHVHTAAFDPLRDEGAIYVERLRGAGVPVDHTCHAGMIHHFYGMGGAVPNALDAVKHAARAAGAALRNEDRRAA